MVSVPGESFARATRARALAMGEAPFTTSTKGAAAIMITGEKSRTGLYGFFG
jgi:hypothetical protein